MKISFKITCFLLLAAIAGGSTVFAQKSETSDGKYYLFKNYTTQNGLLDNGIGSMAQDRNGYIWIGSDRGLTRFDGKSFYHKAIPEIYNNSAFVEYLETTPEGNIISTGLMQGVFVQQDDGRFKQYLRSGYFELGQNIFSSVKVCPDGRILIGSARQLYLLSADSLQEIFYLGYRGTIFTTLDIDKENRIWFGGPSGLGIMQRSETGYKPVFLPGMKDKYVVKILFDDEGTLHVGTRQGYYRIKWRTLSRWESDYTIEQPFPEIADYNINHIYLDKAQNLWIPTSANGVFRTKGDSITLHLTHENGLVSSTVLCLMQDKEGNYWFGNNNGVSMIADFDNYALAKNGVRFKDAYNMISDAYHRIWMYSRSDLHLFQDDRLIPVSLSGTPLEKAGIRDVNIFDSELLISNDVGLYQMKVTEAFPDLRKLRKIADYPSNNITSTRSLVTDTTGIWIAAQNKMYHYRNSQFLPVTFNHPDSIQLRPSKMLKDKYGFYWYGDYGIGLYRGTLSRPDRNTLLFDNITAYKSYKADSAFVTAFISDLTFDKAGNLWFASKYTGVYKLVIDGNGVVSAKLFAIENGLLSNDVSKIYCDDEGKIWFMTAQGINILQYDSTGIETMHKLNVNEGIEGQAYSPLQIGDRLYLLTREGVFVTHHQLDKEKSPKTPNVFITNLLINGLPDSNISSGSNNFHLSHDKSNLTIEYSAVTFRNAADVRYQYKLEGADNDWSILSERGFVEFATLRPGKYTFKVRATMIGAPDETGEETSLSFRILSPYYQTVWFYSLITVVILTLFYAFYQYRMRHIIKMERMRTSIATDLHDDIGSTLSSISLISEMASRQDKEAEMAKALSKIGVDSRDLLNSMDDIIWSVNPKNDALSNLTIRLREYAIPVCESKNITFNMQVDEAVYSLKLGMYERRNVYLISKESINNAVKHSGCTQLSVSFVLNRKQLEIKITDNGCGFDLSKRGHRNGITNMEHRAGQTGMDFIVKSEINNGTTITLLSGL